MEEKVYKPYTSLSLLLKDVCCDYIKPEVASKRKVSMNIASPSTRARLSDSIYTYSKGLVPMESEDVDNEIALMARDFAKNYGQLDFQQKRVLFLHNEELSGICHSLPGIGPFALV